MKQIIECVPNFSEGRDLTVIKQITDIIEGVKLLDIDPGEATNRAGDDAEMCARLFLREIKDAGYCELEEMDYCNGHL